ncbi:hypothetical protein M3484_02975 [Pseudomonas sp. GX19020]|uniref:hypothetical protein n=1 Tax=Pseudomonadota TaxID=1224 RepID=UPI00089D8D91|nr:MULTISPECIES: hypothetical protein [Pseudomonadota]MCL4065539.1 hypothetical protein [Pseudomonas sp. GX19020]SEB73968.1 hypothetical protein SAMN05519105_1211 [Rhodobacter sp. 24-YEA-8]
MTQSGSACPKVQAQYDRNGLAALLTAISRGLCDSRDMLLRVEKAILTTNGNAPAGMQDIDRIGQRLDDLRRLLEDLAAASDNIPPPLPAPKLASRIRLAEIRRIIPGLATEMTRPEPAPDDPVLF